MKIEKSSPLLPISVKGDPIEVKDRPSLQIPDRLEVPPETEGWLSCIADFFYDCLDWICSCLPCCLEEEEDQIIPPPTGDRKDPTAPFVFGNVWIREYVTGPVCADLKFDFGHHLTTVAGETVVISPDDFYVPVEIDSDELKNLFYQAFGQCTHLPACLFRGAKEGSRIRFCMDGHPVQLTCIQQGSRWYDRFEHAFLCLHIYHCRDQKVCLFKEDVPSLAVLDFGKQAMIPIRTDRVYHLDGTAASVEELEKWKELISCISGLKGFKNTTSWLKADFDGISCSGTDIVEGLDKTIRVATQCEQHERANYFRQMRDNYRDGLEKNEGKKPYRRMPIDVGLLSGDPNNFMISAGVSGVLNKSDVSFFLVRNGGEKNGFLFQEQEHICLLIKAEPNPDAFADGHPFKEHVRRMKETSGDFYGFVHFTEKDGIRFDFANMEYVVENGNLDILVPRLTP